MLTAMGCQARRKRLLDKLGSKLDGLPLLLNDPIQLSYLANFWVDPFCLGAGFGGYLLIQSDGHASLFYDNRLPDAVNQVHVDECHVVD